MTRFQPSSLLSVCVAATVSLGLANAQQGTATPANDNGFLTGLRGFESFHEPLGQPIYFESPFNDSGLRALYIDHRFGGGSTLQGGDVKILAMQARLALTERLAFIATKDGHSDLDSGIIDDDGWNDLAGGFKYVAVADKADNFVLTPGIRYEAENGTRSILQGGVSEFSPFVSVAKGFDDLHAIGNVTLRLPTNKNDGNQVLHWDLHFDYDVNPKDSTVFAPLVELHGIHYLSDGATALPVGGGDYTNLGSQPAENFLCWAGLGARVEIDHKYEIGACYEFALTDPNKDIMSSRITIDFIARW